MPYIINKSITKSCGVAKNTSIQGPKWEKNSNKNKNLI